MSRPGSARTVDPANVAIATTPPHDVAWAAERDVAEVLGALETTATGLSAEVATDRLAGVGPNVLAARRLTALDVLLRQLRNPLLILLLGAAGVSVATGDATDGFIIAAIVVLSVGLGFVNEYRSEVAVAALHANVHHQAVVWRDGLAGRQDFRNLVPGDVVDLAVGDIVPADVRLLEVTHLQCDEGVLTGESLPAAKAVAPARRSGAHDGISSVAYMGTIVHQGSGRAVVVGTGSSTAFGQIAVGLTEHQSETAFQVGLRGFSSLLVKVAGVLTISIFVINVAFSRPLLEALLFSLAIAIGITPQLLPAIVSVSLSRGSRRLARKRVLVKRLVTIEDLGNIQILFTDKTGTLTDGTITFDAALDAEGQPAAEVLALGLLCNDATVTAHGPVVGNSLDAALWESADAKPALTDGFGRLASLPFDHDRQLTSVLVCDRAGDTQLVTKGAPEAVLARCSDLPHGASATMERLFAEGSRVVAVAVRHLPQATSVTSADEIDLHLAGFLTFADRPKVGADASIARLRQLGIEVKVITGDNGTVAAKVCAEIGLPVDGVLTGPELEVLDDDELTAAVTRTTVFARVSPTQKARIVKMARREGADIAFLGDGANDAVALHVADVGISVDAAADVAKDAADIVLLDKDLGVLAEGVVEGRQIFANTLKYVLMATSSNFGNMFSAAGASLFLTFLPMLPSQILLNNLLYDVGQLAIPTDNVDPEIVARPSAWDITFVKRFMATFGPISSLFDFATFFVLLGVLHANHAEFRSGWFIESLATQTLVVFVIRTQRVPFLRSRPSLAMILTPPVAALVGAVLPFTPLAGPLGFTAVPLSFFLILLAMTAGYLVLVEAAKARFYATEHHPHRTPPTPSQRRDHHIRRRAHPFTSHRGPRPRAGSNLTARQT